VGLGVGKPGKIEASKRGLKRLNPIREKCWKARLIPKRQAQIERSKIRGAEPLQIVFCGSCEVYSGTKVVGSLFPGHYYLPDQKGKPVTMKGGRDFSGVRFSGMICAEA